MDITAAQAVTDWRWASFKLALTTVGSALQVVGGNLYFPSFFTLQWALARLSQRALSLKGQSMYFRLNLSIVTQLRSDDIWDVLMGLRERGLEKDQWPGTVRDAYETLELAFARTLTHGFGPSCGIASQLDDAVWRHAVLVGQDYLMRVDSLESAYVSGSAA